MTATQHDQGSAELEARSTRTVEVRDGHGSIAGAFRVHARDTERALGIVYSALASGEDRAVDLIEVRIGAEADDAWGCLCGNAPHLDGFYPCTVDGVVDESLDAQVGAGLRYFRCGTPGCSRVLDADSVTDELVEQGIGPLVVRRLK